MNRNERRAILRKQKAAEARTHAQRRIAELTKQLRNPYIIGHYKKRMELLNKRDEYERIASGEDASDQA